MTIEQVCCVFFGVVVEAMTLALGILVGASLRRKEPSHESAERQGAKSSDATG
jgi:hypothetical protein